MTGRRVLAGVALLLALTAGLTFWLWRAARPGPDSLAGALDIATRDIARTLTPEDRRGSFGLDPVFNRFVPPAMPLPERRTALEAAGFTCERAAATALTCSRPAPSSSVTCSHRWIYDTRPSRDRRDVADTGYLSISC